MAEPETAVLPITPYPNAPYRLARPRGASLLRTRRTISKPPAVSPNRLADYERFRPLTPTARQRLTARGAQPSGSLPAEQLHRLVQRRADVRPVTATRTGANALRGLSPSSSTSAAFSASSISAVAQSVQRVQRLDRGIQDRRGVRAEVLGRGSRGRSRTSASARTGTAAGPTRPTARRCASAPGRPQQRTDRRSARRRDARASVRNGAAAREVVRLEQPDVLGIDGLGLLEVEPRGVRGHLGDVECRDHLVEA